MHARKGRRGTGTCEEKKGGGNSPPPPASKKRGGEVRVGSFPGEKEKKRGEGAMPGKRADQKEKKRGFVKSTPAKKSDHAFVVCWMGSRKRGETRHTGGRQKPVE